MTMYKYGTLLRVQNDDPHPDNDVEEGDLHIKAGKHEDGDSYTVMAPRDGPTTVELEPAEIFEADEKLSQKQMQEFVRDSAKEEGYV